MRLICFAAAISVGCVGCFEEPQAGATTTPTSGSSTDASSTSTTSRVTTDETEDEASSASSTFSTTDGTLSGSGSSSSSSSGGAGTTTGSTGTTGTTGDRPEPDFIDEFDRPDAANIGNNWVEKDAPVFSIVNGRAAGIGNPSEPTPSFHDWFVYREDPALDIELVTEFTLNTANLRNEPFILARVAANSLMLGDNYNGYMAVAGTENPPGGAPGNDTLCIIRFGVGGQLQEDWCAQASGTLVTGYRYRLRLTVTGNGPVELNATLERRDLSAGKRDGWEMEAEVSAEDGNGAITDAGVWGFGGGEGEGQISNYAYDNFRAYYLDSP